MNIGDKISKCRKKIGISQEELANELSISRQAVSRWETHESIPDTEKVKALCKFFHVSADYLLFDENEEEIKQISDFGQDCTKKQHFRMVVYVAMLTVGILLVVTALILSLIETYQPYQEYYTAWGPFGTYLLRTWRVIPFALGLFATAVGVVFLYDEYKKM